MTTAARSERHWLERMLDAPQRAAERIPDAEARIALASIVRLVKQMIRSRLGPR